MSKLFTILVATLTAASLQAQSAGGALPPWTAGTLDIHQISTGRGNSALFIFPDGTTMLVDAGALGDGLSIRETDPRPNASRTPGGWIIRYISTMLAPAPPHLDYAVLTHFHPDHMGAPTAKSPLAANGKYKLSGITEVGDAIRIGTLIDRGYDYLPPKADDPLFTNYRAFVDEQRKQGRHVEALRPGRADQIVLRRDARSYPTFQVRNVAANGDVWTGQGDDVKHVFPPIDKLSADDLPSENMCSIGLRIRYGRFDYFTGGDMPGVPDAGAPEWQSVETPVARAIGPTDVHVVNHHGSISTESAFFLSTLRSRVIILPSWSPTHPSQDVLKRILTPRLYPGPRDVFATVLHDATRLSIGARADQFKADHGHIVVRVAPGGDSYQVFVLDDMSEDYKILSVHGPYQSN